MFRRLVPLFIVYIAFSVLNASADSWDDFSAVDRMWDGQKSITNQEFEKVMEKLEEKGKQKEEKQKKKKFKKLFGSGTTLHNELNPDNEINEVTGFKDKEEGILVNLPVQIIIDGKPLEKGFYKVIAERDEDTKKIYINFYQSQFFKGKLEVNETEDDFGEEMLDFARIVPFNENFVKIIFGCIDFNAYAYIPYID